MPSLIRHSRDRLAWLAGYAIATLLSFPHFIAGAEFDLGIWVSWFAPACLVVGLSGLAPAVAMRWTFAASLLGHALLFHWFFVVTVVYGHAPALLGVLAPLAPALYVSCFVALFAGSWAWFEGRSLASPLLAALLWTALEHARSFFLSGFPWASLGYAQHDNFALLGLAPWTGVYGLTFVTVWVGVGAVQAFARVMRGERPGLAAVLALVGGLVVHGAGWSNGSAMDLGRGESQPHLRMAALQGNIDQGVKWSPDWAERTLVLYEDLTREVVAQGARVVVWPETALPGALELDARMHGRVVDLARETGAVLVIGSVGVAIDQPAGHIRAFYDSGFIVSAEGEVQDRYDKTHLVPFGEYVPLRDLLGRVLGAVASGMTSGDVTAGEEVRAVALPITAGGGSVTPAEPAVRAGVPICYELLFPDLVRRFAGSGAEVLLAMTNDAWYGATGAPYQFLAMTALRSAESGLWTVRAANTGVSAIIDAHGRVLDETPIFERGYVVGDVALGSSDEPTLYVRFGDWIAWLCWLAAAGFAIGAFRRGTGRG